MSFLPSRIDEIAGGEIIRNILNFGILFNPMLHQLTQMGEFSPMLPINSWFRAIGIVEELVR
jgi:hypothetical protein